jgi:multidrug resistance efflux pump
MELIITIAYYFLVRLIFFDYKLLNFNLFWGFIVFGIYSVAILTEVIGLGQYTPFSKSMFVQSYVVQMAPEFGGIVTKVNVRPNEPLKKGDTLFQMDPEPWQYKVDEYEAQLAAAGTNVAILSKQVDEAKSTIVRIEVDLETAIIQYKQIAEAAERKAAAKIRVEQARKKVDELRAELLGARAKLNIAELGYRSEIDGQPTQIAEVIANLGKAKYHLKATTIVAPSDGYVINLQLHPGSFIRLKTPVMAFVSTEEKWLAATVPQRGMKHVHQGDTAQVAFAMYPGEVFDAVVESAVWGNGNAQGLPSGQIPRQWRENPSNAFMVRLRLLDENPEMPLRFGANGLVAIFTKDAADIFVVLRKIELQTESFMYYLYNPF